MSDINGTFISQFNRDAWHLYGGQPVENRGLCYHPLLQQLEFRRNHTNTSFVVKRRDLYRTTLYSSGTSNYLIKYYFGVHYSCYYNCI